MEVKEQNVLYVKVFTTTEAPQESMLKGCILMTESKIDNLSHSQCNKCHDNFETIQFPFFITMECLFGCIPMICITFLIFDLLVPIFVIQFSLDIKTKVIFKFNKVFFDAKDNSFSTNSTIHYIFFSDSCKIMFIKAKMSV